MAFSYVLVVLPYITSPHF